MNDHDLLVRIDERTERLEKVWEGHKDLHFAKNGIEDQLETLRTVNAVSKGIKATIRMWVLPVVLTLIGSMGAVLIFLWGTGIVK